ncbi:MAG: hypothetical protein QXR59_00585 [Candidatus Bathyarchaeia archaeon]
MLMDEYRRSWALRYLREAADEIKMARRDSRALDLIPDALRKAQIAIYYSLGEPAFIEQIVEESSEGRFSSDSPILRCLVEIERIIKRLESAQGPYELIISESDQIISLASRIVSLFLSNG